MVMTRQQISYGTQVRKLLWLGLPLVGSTVANFVIHMTDTIMLGWYSVTSLAASTIATSIWFVIFMLGAGFGNAVMPLVAAAAAAGDEVRARRVTRMSLWLSLAFFGLAFAPLWWSEQLMLMIGQTPDVAAESQRYLRIGAFGMIPALVAVGLRAFLSALEFTGILLWVTIVGIFLNAGVNYALIFGNWGAPELGIRGAAIASVTIQSLTLVVLAAYAHYKLPDYSLFQRIWKPDWQAMKEVFVLGLPIGLTALAESGLFTAGSIMMGWIGEIELAAHGIAMQITALLFMFHVGMSQAATVRAGGAFGRRDQNSLKQVAIAAYGIAIAFGVFAILLMVTLPAEMASLFIDPTDPARDQLISLAVTLVLMSALFQFMDGTQIVALSLLRGVQDTTVPMWLASLSYWVIGLPASYVMAFTLDWGAVGIWLGLTVGLGMAALLLGLRFWTYAIKIEG